MGHYILKIDCSDAKGLIYHIADIIYKNDLNIEKNNEFVDEENQKFFFRARISGEVDPLRLKEQLERMLPQDANVAINVRKKKSIVLMATKESHCLGDILLKHDSGELNANVQAVIANHEILGRLAERFEIPFFHISAENLERRAHEEKVLRVLEEFAPDYIVLAKYMRILSSDFVRRYPNRILNIHHSFLPAFIGANPYKQAHQRGVKIIGATAHFVNDNLDEGPIIAQDVIRVNHEYTWRDMQRAGRNVEKTVLSQALDLALDDRIFVYGNKTIIF